MYKRFTWGMCLRGQGARGRSLPGPAARKQAGRGLGKRGNKNNRSPWEPGLVHAGFLASARPGRPLLLTQVPPETQSASVHTERPLPDTPAMTRGVRTPQERPTRLGTGREFPGEQTPRDVNRNVAWLFLANGGRLFMPL